MSSHYFERRDFLKGAGTFASVPLIGTMLAAEPYQATQAPALKGSAQSVVIPTHEWAGELDERLDFPADWDVLVLQMRGSESAVLTPQQIGGKLAQPIGSTSLRELAEGKKRVAVTCKNGATTFDMMEQHRKAGCPGARDWWSTPSTSPA